MRTGILEFLWGLGVFLFGIYYLEQAVAVFSRGGFKKLLKKFTSNTTSSLLTGIISTVIVQSSNLISVLVLAFVGTGILSLTGALAVMLGANIGTTIPDALLASIGLHYDIKILTFPLVFLGAIGITFFSRYEKVVMMSKVLISLALIFLSFSFMKSGLLFITEMVDLSAFMDMNAWIFFLIGLLLTLLVQSGGAIFIVALTSVSSGLITPETAFPIIFGSYVGATVTIIIGSLGHQPAIKKQVAAGHVGFNILVALLGMLSLPWLKLLFLNQIFPLLWEVRSLAVFYVAFRTLVAVLVFPFLWFFARVFQNSIKEDDQHFSLAIQKIQTSSVDPELALLAVKQDLLVYFKEVISYNLNIWDFYVADVVAECDVEKVFQRDMNFGKTYLKKEYQEIKDIQEQLLDFLAKMSQMEVQKSEEADQISSLYQVVIDIGDSSKYLKDVWNRVEDWQWSTGEQLQKDYETLRKMVRDFYKSVLQLLANLDNQEAFSLLHEVLEKIEKNDKKYLTMFKRKEGDDVDLANLLQVSRYFSMSCMALVRAIESISLSGEEKKYLKENIRELF